MSSKSIVNLNEEPGHLDTLAEWHHLEWSYLNPASSVSMRAEKMRSYLTEDAIPSTYVYKLDGELAGSAAIVAQDMDTHKELSPWLASVYVKPELRGKGIGSKLVLHVMQGAKDIGIETLYLFTDSKANFYAKLGWSVLSEEVYRGCRVTIMKVRLRG